MLSNFKKSVHRAWILCYNVCRKLSQINRRRYVLWAEFSRELYRCDKCGKLRSDMKIELLDGGEVILSKSHPCRRCRTPMSIVEGPDGLKCPKCKSDLAIADMLLWD